MTREQFPEVPIGTVTATRPYTAPGLFAERQLQALNLLNFPDLHNAEISTEHRRQVLRSFVSVKRPLAALALFCEVVALEDFIRDLGARLADLLDQTTIFPEVHRLRSIPLKPDPIRPFARLDKDPAPLTDYAEVNKLYFGAIGVAPIPVDVIPRLSDLALIRHTVAHHAAIIRAVDVQRFQFWQVRPNSYINPPVEFIEGITRFVYEAGSKFESAIRDRVFSMLLPTLPGWSRPNSAQPMVLALLELFNYFGKLITTAQPSPPFDGTHDFERNLRDSHEQMRKELESLCLLELKAKYPENGAA